jgi:hypothetical protein
MICGLNQLGLCEEKGFDVPQELIWDEDEDPVEVIAGNVYMSIYKNMYLFICISLFV